MRKFILSAFILFAAALLTPQGSPAQEACDHQAGAETAQFYLEQLDAFAFEQVWRALTPLYQSLHDEFSWQKRQMLLREAYGPVMERTLSLVDCRETFYHSPDGQYCLVQFKTSFLNKRAAVETIILDVRAQDFWPIAELRIN